MQSKGWTGGGRFQMARVGDGVLIHFNHLTSRGGKFQSNIGDFFRKSARDIRPVYGPFGARIWVQHSGKERRIDVDNVAKACLDSLTGILWYDDAQVKTLRVDKISEDQDQVYFHAFPLEAEPDDRELATLLKDVD